VVSERLRKVVNLDKLGRYIPLNPNLLTLLSGLVAWGGVPLVLLLDLPPWLFILASGILDGLDGAVARSRGVVSRRGAFLDSFLDRYSDAAYLVYFWKYVDPLVIYIALMGTFAISYVRCRGEALGVEVRGVGFMERGERTVYLFLTSLIGVASPRLVETLLYLYATLVNAAALHRGFVVFRRLSFK
jgi:archaetidylinositol phosphate synthase